jgi:hypothetical protein
VLLNPIHANIKNPRLWEVECDQVAHDVTKGGAKRMRLVRELPVPQVTMEQRVRFAILCAKEVCHDPQFVAWADGWLSGGDRSKEAAEAASWAAQAASWAATGANIDLIALAQEACRTS